MSRSHARLLRVLGDWVVEDTGSKNGTLVNGQPVQRAVLADGDLLEAGRTFFIFRRHLPGGAEPSPHVEAKDLEVAAPGLATLLPSLGAEFEKLSAVAPSPVSVLVRGETGTGKEVVASALHALSGRPGAFQAVNCGALPQSLLESSLFGHCKGAFSGADEDRPGLIRAADGGTLFLDEIGDLPVSAQMALLRVLQEGEVVPVGAARPVQVDVRLVAATHRDLDALVAEGRFRPDLLARLLGVVITLPPLRERREDLGLLIGELLRRHFPGPEAEQVRFSAEAARALLRHSWPLNIRELEKCLASAVVLARSGAVERRHLPESLVSSRPAKLAAGAAAALSPSDQERRARLVSLLQNHAGNIAAVARELGKARTQIQRWIKRYRIDLHRMRH